MKGSLAHTGSSLPSLFVVPPRDFFSSHIHNPHRHRVYLEAVRQFGAFCADLSLRDLREIEPIHVAGFVEAQLRLNAWPTVKQRLAAQRRLFNWMVVGQVISANPTVKHRHSDQTVFAAIAIVVPFTPTTNHSSKCGRPSQCRQFVVSIRGMGSVHRLEHSS